MYSERLLDHFRNPRRAGAVANATVTVTVENMACGDQMQLSARVADGVVAEAAFLVKGCTASIACGSAVAEWMTGRSTRELKGLSGAAIAAAVEAEVDGLPPASKHAAALCADAVRALIRAGGES